MSEHDIEWHDNYVILIRKAQEHAEMLELLRGVVEQAKSQQEEQRPIMINADKFLVDASDLIDRIDKGE